jgi:hypothetical protein
MLGRNVRLIGEKIDAVALGRAAFATLLVKISQVLMQLCA